MSDIAIRPPVGALLRDWRQRRRLSQLELSIEAEVSTRHLSFVETGRAQPSRTMILRLADHLDIPLRERNTLLLAAGLAPAYSALALDDVEMAPVREAIDLVLRGFEPFPAAVIDRRWNLVAANRSAEILTAGAAEHLLGPGLNVLRLSMHPDGLAPRIVNLPQWRSHLLHRLAHDVRQSGDPELERLYEELDALPGGHDASPPTGIAVPLRVRHEETELAFLSTVTTFGSAVDLTAAELSIEAFLPADARTASAIRELAGG